MEQLKKAGPFDPASPHYDSLDSRDAALTKMVLDREKVSYQEADHTGVAGEYHTRFYVQSIDPEIDIKKKDMLKKVVMIDVKKNKIIRALFLSERDRYQVQFDKNKNLIHYLGILTKKQ